MGITTNTHEGLKNTTGDLNIINNASNGDVVIKGNDGGSTITALTLDMSDSGNATFTGDVTVEGGLLHLGKADTASGHINAKELMTFNIDTDNDDTNRYFGFYVNGESGSGTELLKILETGDATFAGDVALGGGALQSYHANVTSALALDDQTSVFTRANQMFLGNNFYYGASDGGIAIEADKSSLIQIDRDKVRFFFAASVSAGASASLQEKFRLDDTGKLTIPGEIEGGSLDINGNADIAGNLVISGTTALDVTADVNDNWAGRFENTNSGVMVY